MLSKNIRNSAQGSTFTGSSEGTGKGLRTATSGQENRCSKAPYLPIQLKKTNKKKSNAVVCNCSK